MTNEGMKMKIGILDSGVGGLTVLKECLKQLPNHEYLYFADSKNAPYGTKPKEEVHDLTENAVRFLLAEGAEILVIACNTATSVAIERLREAYDVPIIGMEPAVKPALKKASGKRVLVTATELTLKEEKFQTLINALDAGKVIDLCPLSELVTFAEEGEFSEAVVIPYLEERFHQFNLSLYGGIVLGCTHFPLFKSAFETILPEGVTMIDGSQGTVNRISQFITSESDGPDFRLFRSGEPLEEGPLFDLVRLILELEE